MDKRFWAVIGIVVVIFGGIFYFNDKSNEQSASSNSNAKPTNHVEGPADAKVTLVEYGDFQCPVCSTYYPILKQVEAKYGDVIKFQFRHLPLTSIHQNALAAARAAEAASNQGKFWQMYDLLYQNQQSWSSTGNPSSAFNAYAQQIGLDTARFQKDSSSSAVNDTINADRAEANRLKLTSTPSFFINDKAINLQDLVDPKTRQPTAAQFAKQLDPVIKQTGGTVPAEPSATETQAATGQ